MPDRFLVAVATLQLLSAHAEEHPLVVVVDDLQWVDPETSAALRFCARRLGHDAVAILLTLRRFAEVALDDDESGIDRLSLAGLHDPDARLLLAGSVADALVGPLVSRTGGNPLALLEVTRTMSPAQRRGSTPLPAALPVGTRLSEAFARSAADLSPAARRATVLAAAAFDSEEGPLIRALEAEGVDSAAALADAESSGVLTANDNSVQFRHPLQRNAAWLSATATQRRTAHASLAAVLEHRPGARLRHLAEASTGPDDQLATDLLTMARTERTRWGYAGCW